MCHLQGWLQLRILFINGSLSLKVGILIWKMRKVQAGQQSLMKKIKLLIKNKPGRMTRHHRNIPHISMSIVRHMKTQGYHVILVYKLTSCLLQPWTFLHEF